MSAAELILILIVALIVFGPNKLPMLATHIGLLVRKLNGFKEQAVKLWKAQLDEIQLLENTRKAQEADKHYEDKHRTES